MDPLGVPILDKNRDGYYVDQEQRIVSAKGYLIDKNDNVIDKRGNVVFRKQLLDADGDIPKVFRTGLLKSDTASSLSRLMSEIERNQPSELEDQNHDLNQEEYDMEDDDEYGSEEEEKGMRRTGMSGTGMSSAMGLAKKKRKKRKTRKRAPEYDDPSLREHLLAGAYGGVAKPKPKRAGLKYTTDIDAGLRDIATPAMLRDAQNFSGVTRTQLYPAANPAPLSSARGGVEGQGRSSSRNGSRTRLHRNGTAGQTLGSLARSDMGSDAYVEG